LLAPAGVALIAPRILVALLLGERDVRRGSGDVAIVGGIAYERPLFPVQSLLALRRGVASGCSGGRRTLVALIVLLIFMLIAALALRSIVPMLLHRVSPRHIRRESSAASRVPRSPVVG
jgi:hypothetical protein